MIDSRCWCALPSVTDAEEYWPYFRDPRLLLPISDYLERSQFSTAFVAVGLVIVAMSLLLLASRISDLLPSLLSIYVGVLISLVAYRIRQRSRRRFDRMFWRAFPSQDRWSLSRGDRGQLERELLSTSQRIRDLENEIEGLRAELIRKERSFDATKNSGRLE